MPGRRFAMVMQRIDAAARTLVRHIPFPPIHALFEPTTVCNLGCSRCRRSQSSSVAQIPGKDKHLTPGRFKEVLDKLRHITVAEFIGDGEPLMNPDWNKLIEIASGKGIKTQFNTNGMLVTKEDVNFWKKHKVIEVGISLDTANPETFERLRPGAKFDRVIKTCKMISEAGLKLQLSNILFAESVPNLPDYIDLCKEVGAKVIAIPRPHLYGTLKKYLSAYPDPEVANPILKIALDKARAAGIRWFEPWYVTTYFKRCMWPFLAPYIQIGGTIQPCCFIVGKDRTEYYDGVAYEVPATSYEMGNIYDDDFNKIWRGDAFKELRQLLIKTEKPIGTTIEAKDLHALKSDTSSRFSHCVGCAWRWSVEC